MKLMSAMPSVYTIVYTVKIAIRLLAAYMIYIGLFIDCPGSFALPSFTLLNAILMLVITWSYMSYVNYPLCFLIMVFVGMSLKPFLKNEIQYDSAYDQDNFCDTPFYTLNIGLATLLGSCAIISTIVPSILKIPFNDPDDNGCEKKRTDFAGMWNGSAVREDDDDSSTSAVSHRNDRKQKNHPKKRKVSKPKKTARKKK